MKILLTSLYYKPHVGGIENSLFYLAQAYKQQGHDVLIVACDSAPAGTEKLPAEEIIDEIRVVRFSSYRSAFSLLNFFKYKIEVNNCTRLFKSLKFNPDVVITRNHFTGYAALKAGFKNIIYLVPGVVRFQDSSYVVSSNNSIKHKITNYGLNLLMRYSEDVQKKVLLNSNKIFVFSNNMYDQVKKVAPTLNEILLTKPGIDKKYFDNKLSRETARMKLGIGNDLFVFLTLSRLAPHKSIDIAINAFAAIDTNIKSVLLIVGEGIERNNLENLVKSKGISERVIFAGSTNDSLLYYACANVFLLPSKHEPFGQTILEALSMGLPIVAFNSNNIGIETATSEIVNDESMGILCENSINGFSDAMNTILQTAEEYRIDSTEIKRRFSWDNLANHLIEP